jgi:hypothetical protein
MRTTFLLCLLFVLGKAAESQDLPNPPANLQTLPEGSYVIAMDNALQLNADPTVAKRVFNLKAYGLVVYLLNNNIRVRRVVRAGKAKDAVDFSVSAQLVKPQKGSASVLDFKAGPFVVFADDVFHNNIDKLIDSYNNNAGGVSGITSATYKVKVYKTTADATVDVRFDYIGWRPKVCVLNDGKNAVIHTTYLTVAGVPSTNYTVDYNTELSTNCYTFASEPHNSNPDPAVVANITSFVNQGGNFLAECEAISNYEAVGHFHSTNGFTVTNSNPTAVSYPNPDLNYAQFDGAFDINQGGSCSNWKLATGSSFTNYAHSVATNTGSGASIAPYGASAAKVNALSTSGGMVFYLGNHNYNTLTDYNSINGIRMYLNAVLTPSNAVGLMQYTYKMSCNTSTMQVRADNGPGFAYPITFYLYADVGSTAGAYDAGDSYLGAATVANPGETKSIYVSPPFNNNTDFVMKVTPTTSCFKVEYMQPSSCQYITLPAQLKNFSAQRLVQDVLLQWQMAYESTVAGFYVQRFENGQWKNKAYVLATDNHRMQGSDWFFDYKDAADFKGSVQYRLAVVNANGQMTYSGIKQVSQETSGAAGYTIYPVPSHNGSITIQFATTQSRSVTIIDLNGKQVRHWEAISDAQLKIEQLQPGVYIVQVKENSAVQQQKIVIF